MEDNNKNVNGNGEQPQPENNENKKMSTGKKIIIGVVAAGIAVGAFFGIRAAVRSRRNKQQ
jgi:hypothetical protein